MGYDPSEIYVTEAEQEAYDLAGQMALGNCRSHGQGDTWDRAFIDASFKERIEELRATEVSQ